MDGHISPCELAARAIRVVAVTGVALMAAVGTLLLAAPGASAATTTTTKPAPKTTTTTTSAASNTGNAAATTLVLHAISAEQALGSVHITGSITQGRSVINLNLTLNGDGEGGGQFVQDGSSIRIDRLGSSLYFNAPKKFWATHATPAQTKEYGGKWIEFSALDTRFESFDQFLDAADLVAAAFQGHTTPLTVSRPTTYAKHKVVVVKDVETRKGKTTTSIMDVAATGKPYVYRIVDDTPSEVGTLVFSHYGKPAAFTIPPEAINLTG